MNNALIKTDRRQTLHFGEFVALMALLIALVALSIDAMLPALADIGQSLGVQRANDNQLIISLFILGMAIGQIIYGPISDSTGRKPAIYGGVGLFMLGCLLCLTATNFSMMLIGRVLQGLGAAGPRIVTISLIRDQYEGRDMAQVMSFIMTVFILVPVIAPSLGQLLLIVAHWRAIFAMFLLLATIAWIWFALRQPETLTPDHRRPFSLIRIGLAAKEVCFNRVAFGYTLATGLIFGAFLGYLNSAQQIFQMQYGLGQQFPLYFAALALALGLASFLNTRLVMRFGTRPLSRGALQAISGTAIIFLGVTYIRSGHPPLWSLMFFFVTAFFCVGLLFGNLNALAMQPLGHIAGVGAAVVGSLSTFISVSFGTLIGQNYNGTILPLIVGFAILSTSALIVMQWVEHRRPLSQQG